MSEKRSPKDEQLIKSLQEKLDWYTFEATDEEFDEAQVEAILSLLQSLDPLPEMYVPRDPLEPSVREVPIADADPNIELGPDGKPVLASDPVAAFERFKKRYHITDEDLAAKDRAVGKEGGVIKPFRMDVSDELTPDTEEVKAGLAQEVSGDAVQDSSVVQATGTDGVSGASGQSGIVTPIESKTAKRRAGKAVGKVAAAAVIVAAAGTALSIGTSAVAQKPFFEVVRDGMHSIKITVTGNRMESEAEDVDLQREKVYYDSWEEVKAEHEEILIPTYIPDGLELKKLNGHSSESYENYLGTYWSKDNSDEIMTIGVQYFEDSYRQIRVEEQDNWEFLQEKEGISYYYSDDGFHAIWHDKNCLYMIKWVNIEELKRTVEGMM